MSPFLTLMLAGMAGIGLGVFYFGGLWLTLQRVSTCRWPTPLFLCSFAGRTAVVVLGFYFVMGGSWQRVLACLVGFMLARQFLIFRLGPERLLDISQRKEQG